MSFQVFGRHFGRGDPFGAMRLPATSRDSRRRLVNARNEECGSSPGVGCGVYCRAAPMNQEPRSPSRGLRSELRSSGCPPRRGAREAARTGWDRGSSARLGRSSKDHRTRVGSRCTRRSRCRRRAAPRMRSPARSSPTGTSRPGRASARARSRGRTARSRRGIGVERRGRDTVSPRRSAQPRLPRSARAERVARRLSPALFVFAARSPPVRDRWFPSSESGKLSRGARGVDWQCKRHTGRAAARLGVVVDLEPDVAFAAAATVPTIDDRVDEQEAAGGLRLANHALRQECPAPGSSTSRRIVRADRKADSDQLPEGEADVADAVGDELLTASPRPEGSSGRRIGHERIHCDACPSCRLRVWLQLPLRSPDVVFAPIATCLDAIAVLAPL